MEIYGLWNLTTNEKLIVARPDNWRWVHLQDWDALDGNEEDNYHFLSCGVYSLAVGIGSTLGCMKCNGTGGNEELSGGHKKQCEECFGSGLDPVKLEKFEKLPLAGIWKAINGFKIYWSELFVPHDDNCTKCKAFRYEVDLGLVAPLNASLSPYPYKGM